MTTYFSANISCTNGMSSRRTCDLSLNFGLFLTMKEKQDMRDTQFICEFVGFIFALRKRSSGLLNDGKIISSGFIEH